MTTPEPLPRLVLKRSLSRSERIVQLLSPDVLLWFSWGFFLLFVSLFLYFAYGLYLAVRLKLRIVENAVVVVAMGFFLYQAVKGQLSTMASARRNRAHILTEVVITDGFAELENQLGERLGLSLHEAEVRMQRNKVSGDAWVSFAAKGPDAPTYLIELQLTREAWQALVQDLKQHQAAAAGL